jgi:hypothetical protein
MEIEINLHRDLTGLYILLKGLSIVFCVQEKFLTGRTGASTLHFNLGGGTGVSDFVASLAK